MWGKHKEYKVRKSQKERNRITKIQQNLMLETEAVIYITDIDISRNTNLRRRNKMK